MEQQHTSEFLAGMFGAYLSKKTKIYHKGCYDENAEIECEYLLGVDIDSETIYAHPMDSYGDWRPLNEYYLGLTPLSKISDEHKRQVAEICEHIGSCMVICDGDTFEFQYSDSVSYIEVNHLPASVIDYLRSHGYDCGYLHIPSLIAAGLAVDASNPTAERSVANQAK